MNDQQINPDDYSPALMKLLDERKNDILYAESSGAYCLIYFRNEKDPYLTSRNLSWVCRLAPFLVRLHLKYAANINSIVTVYQTADNRKSVAKLVGGKRLPVAVNRLPAIRFRLATSPTNDEQRLIDYNYETDPDTAQAMLDQIGGIGELLTFTQTHLVEIVTGADGQSECWIEYNDSTGCWAVDMDATTSLLRAYISFYKHNKKKKPHANQLTPAQAKAQREKEIIEPEVGDPFSPS